MSGIKSPSRKAPATDALIVAHGQPSDPVPAEEALAALADRVRQVLPGLRIASATMANPGVLERAIEALPEQAPVYPLFMAEGWFVKTALAKRLEGYNLRVLPPLGHDARLPALAAEAALQVIHTNGWNAADAHILLAAHGSAKGGAAAESARLFAGNLSAALPGTSVSIGFVEEAPFLADAAAAMTAQRSTHMLCLPFFAMEGEHVRDDIPEALQQAGFTGPVLPPFGLYDTVAGLIGDALRADLDARRVA